MNTITLNENFRIEKDTYSCVLIFSEERHKENKDSVEKESFVFEDKWYYPDVRQVLRKYIDLDLKSSKSIDELIEKMEIIDKKITELKNTLFNKN